jgi:hypothetical protein
MIGNYPSERVENNYINLHRGKHVSITIKHKPSAATMERQIKKLQGQVRKLSKRPNSRGTSAEDSRTVWRGHFAYAPPDPELIAARERRLRWSQAVTDYLHGERGYPEAADFYND